MREQINAHLDRGGEGLQPEVKAALERLRAEEKIAA
jgi:hypothetical protein